MELGLFREAKQASNAYSRYSVSSRSRKEISRIHPIRTFATLAFRLVERQRPGPYLKDYRCFLMGSARVGQIHVVVAGMNPVANVEGEVRHAAVLGPTAI